MDKDISEAAKEAVTPMLNDGSGPEEKAESGHTAKSRRRQKRDEGKRGRTQKVRRYKHHRRKENVKNQSPAGDYGDAIKRFIIRTAIEDGGLDTGYQELAADMAGTALKNASGRAVKPFGYMTGVAKRIFGKAAGRAADYVLKLLFHALKLMLKLFMKAVGALAAVLGVSIPVIVIIMAAGIAAVITGAFVIDTHVSAAMGAEYIREYVESIEATYDEYDEVDINGGASASDNSDDILLIFMTRDDVKAEDAIRDITERMLYYEEDEEEAERLIVIPGSTKEEKRTCETCNGTGAGCTSPLCMDGYVTVTVTTAPSTRTETYTKTVLRVYLLTAKDWERDYYIPDKERYKDMTELFAGLGYSSGGGDSVCRYFNNLSES